MSQPVLTKQQILQSFQEDFKTFFPPYTVELLAFYFGELADAIQAGGGGGSTPDVIQVAAAGPTVTVSNGTNILYLDFAAAQDVNVILPTTPHSSNEVQIFMGGTIAGGNSVSNNLTVSPAAGQTLLQVAAFPIQALSGECLTYKIRISNSIWYRKN